MIGILYYTPVFNTLNSHRTLYSLKATNSLLLQDSEPGPYALLLRERAIAYNALCTLINVLLTR